MQTPRQRGNKACQCLKLPVCCSTGPTSHYKSKETKGEVTVSSLIFWFSFWKLSTLIYITSDRTSGDEIRQIRRHVSVPDVSKSFYVTWCLHLHVATTPGGVPLAHFWGRTTCDVMSEKCDHVGHWVQHTLKIHCFQCRAQENLTVIVGPRCIRSLPRCSNKHTLSAQNEKEEKSFRNDERALSPRFSFFSFSREHDE